MKIFKKRRFYVLSISLLIFLSLMILMLKNDVLGIDEAGYNFISKYMIKNNITPFIKFITNLGGGLFLLLMTVGSFFVIKNRKIFYGIVANLSCSLILNLSLKEILHRNRPVTNRIIEEIGYSFPSGHAMVSMAFYGFFIYLIYVYCDKKKFKWPLIIFLTINILAIGISRVYLGVHYLSDVIAGFTFSLAYLIVFVYLFNLYLNYNTKR